MLHPTTVRSRISYFLSDKLVSCYFQVKRSLLPTFHRCLQLKCSTVHKRVDNTTSHTHTLTLQQSQCLRGLPVTLPTYVPFKFGLQVKVLPVQDQIHVVLPAQVGPRGGVDTELEEGPSGKSSLRGPWQKAPGADRGRPERPPHGRCLPCLRGQNSAETGWP